ncbi:ester cyclase [Amycolatopsis plumensis]|uniref:Ester cyclase n=1 Tax=Amycolatopsis plumensis TaxID=236508 RepID=A0ABV5U7P5_9PSEU
MTSDAELAVRYVDYLVGGDEAILEEAFAPDFLDHVSGRRGTDMMRVVRGWLERSFAGRQPTGRRIVAEAVHIFRVRDGRLAEHWAVRDDLGVLRQLEGGEAPGERPRRPA